jgi:radical SAM protein with 4Fe4S-binding SPASM domain
MIPVAPGFPRMIVLAITYKCNGRCPSCPYTSSNIRESYSDAPYMPPEVFYKVADEAGPHRTWLRLSGGGDPMLHPRTTKMVRYAKERGCRIGIITNGTNFTRRDIGDLLACGVDLVEFSVDAGDPETYARVRPGLRWDRLVEAVDTFRALRDALGAPTRLLASAVVQKGVDVDAAEAFWKRRVDVFQRRKYLTWGILDSEQSADPRPYLEETDPCPFLFERLNIDTRGKVVMCGFDIAGRTNMGNVLREPLEEIWQGEKFRRVRELHARRRGREVKLCQSCSDLVYRSWTHNFWKLVRRAGVPQGSDSTT